VAFAGLLSAVLLFRRH
ncbi:MAG: hypothetical protein IMY69_04430, partial [Bacteroidetes bacterium]|nr:hypothetical protein [Bacteroidota bacterium]